MSLSRIQLIANSIFKLSGPNREARSSAGTLSTNLVGPRLKSHWPVTKVDVTKTWKSQFSSIIGLPNITKFCASMLGTYNRLPYSLSQVYRVSIAEFRFNRGKNLRKGTTLCMQMDLKLCI